MDLKLNMKAKSINVLEENRTLCDLGVHEIFLDGTKKWWTIKKIINKLDFTIIETFIVSKRTTKTNKQK